VMSLAQLKIMQEVITLAVFVPFAVLYMDQPVKLDFLWAGLCLMGAVYVMFRWTDSVEADVRHDGVEPRIVPQRIEPRIDRDRARVEVLDVWWEDGFKPRRAEGFVDAMRDGLRAYLRFASADRLDWAPHLVTEKRLFLTAAER